MSEDEQKYVDISEVRKYIKQIRFICRRTEMVSLKNTDYNKYEKIMRNMFKGFINKYDISIFEKIILDDPKQNEILEFMLEQMDKVNKGELGFVEADTKMDSKNAEVNLFGKGVKKPENYEQMEKDYIKEKTRKYEKKMAKKHRRRKK